MLTDQWFVAMSKPSEHNMYRPGKSIAEAALDAVKCGDVKFIPENWTTTYNQW
jgi:valyl-tRNA synthetase